MVTEVRKSLPGRKLGGVYISSVRLRAVACSIKLAGIAASIALNISVLCILGDKTREFFEMHRT